MTTPKPVKAYELVALLKNGTRVRLSGDKAAGVVAFWALPATQTAAIAFCKGRKMDSLNVVCKREFEVGPKEDELVTTVYPTDAPVVYDENSFALDGENGGGRAAALDAEHSEAQAKARQANPLAGGLAWPIPDAAEAAHLRKVRQMLDDAARQSRNSYTPTSNGQLRSFGELVLSLVREAIAAATPPRLGVEAADVIIDVDANHTAFRLSIIFRSLVSDPFYTQIHFSGLEVTRARDPRSLAIYYAEQLTRNALKTITRGTTKP